MLADCLISMTRFLQDISFSSCLIFSSRWLDSLPPFCQYTISTNFALYLIPFYFRFMQSLRRYFDNRDTLNLLNALKYLVMILAGIFNIFAANGSSMESLWLITLLMGSTYAYGWDIYIDWGLFRIWDKNKFGLRSKLMYPKKFYYFAIFSNFCLRYLWVVS